ncbi:hypothetical protein NC796_07285 [Aliifodinibius sp. S!AR15-10]|nr:hypothetical protein [Aliifodinibius sp. S!AR15-10]
MLLLFAGCKQSMVISDVNYSQPIETVLTPNENGVVEDVQHGLSFNILPLQYAETEDTSSVTTREVRMIRGKEGFYYITAAGYSNVYVMAPEKNQLKLKKKIKISEEGIEQPAFNQRDTYVQLLNRETEDTYMLTEEGVKQTDQELASREEN